MITPLLAVLWVLSNFCVFIMVVVGLYNDHDLCLVSGVINLLVHSAAGFISKGLVEASDIRYYIMLLFRGLIYPILEPLFDNHINPAPYLFKAVTFPLHVIFLHSHEGNLVYDTFCIVE